jgi:hypothetical protein
MRLDDLCPALVRRAVGLYFEHAWPPAEGGAGVAAPRLSRDHLEGAATLGELFERFERARTADGAVRCTLRLGNPRYPFMKFVVQEYRAVVITSERLVGTSTLAPYSAAV